ncbi:hypothetical protein [Aquimarina sp. AU474]|uniref:hypothetical protein n=1 Tax=Aquimarina sp. AU474 TaxID=2108529 RepID=UPI000D68945F|nr:hypothetical protein [Aquimarina sp. AU474]
MKNDLNNAEIRLIIHNLITFIVVDAKEYVSDKHKKEYVLGYVHLLIKTINLIDDDVEFSVIEDIANDISMYLE